MQSKKDISSKKRKHRVHKEDPFQFDVKIFSVKNILIAITAIVACVSILLTLIGGLYIALLFVAIPFTILGLFILWGSYVYSSALAQHASKNYLLKIILVVLAILSLCGVMLLIRFAAFGGPNEGIDKHLFGDLENPYLDMQVGLALLVGSTIVGLSVLAYTHLKHNR